MNRRPSTSSYGGLPKSNNILKPRNSEATPLARRNSRSSNASSAVKRGSKLSNNEHHKRISIGQMSNRVTPTKNNAAYLGVPQSLGRPSIESQRSSIGAGGSKFSRKESRPVTTPAFKSKCIDNVLEYILTNDCAAQINRKSLINPTTRDFINIFNTIYRVFVSNFTLQQPFENEIYKILQTLEYPVQIPKSSFKTVGSPHTWPSILYMLTWLVDLVNLYSTVDIEHVVFLSDLDCPMKPHFDCAIDIRKAETEEELELCYQTYRHNMEIDLNYDPNEEERLYMHLSEIDDEIKDLQSVPNEVEMNERKHLELISDKNKLFTYFDELKNHLDTRNLQIEHLHSKAAEAENRIAIIDEKYQKLEMLKQGQNMSSAEFRKLKLKMQEMKRSQERLKNESQAIHENTWKTEIQIGKLHDAISVKLVTFNSLSLDADIEELKISSNNEELLQELEDKKDVLRSLRKQSKQQTFNSELLLSQQKEKLTNLHELNTEREVEKKKLTSKIKRCEEELKCTKKCIAVEEAEIQSKLDELHDKLMEEKKKYHSTYNSNNDNLEKLQQEYDKVIEANNQRMQDGASFIVKICQHLIESTEARNNAMVEFNTSFKQKLQEGMKCFEKK